MRGIQRSGNMQGRPVAFFGVRAFVDKFTFSLPTALQKPIWIWLAQTSVTPIELSCSVRTEAKGAATSTGCIILGSPVAQPLAKANGSGRVPISFPDRQIHNNNIFLATVSTSILVVRAAWAPTLPVSPGPGPESSFSSLTPFQRSSLSPQCRPWKSSRYVLQYVPELFILNAI